MKLLVLLICVFALVLGIRFVARIERDSIRRMALACLITATGAASLVAAHFATEHISRPISLSIMLFSLTVPVTCWIAYFAFRRDRKPDTA